MVAFELNHYMRRKKQGVNGIAGLKIDISKAYDRLECDFIQNMMLRFDFYEIWIDRVMSFIRSVSYSFLHNGEEFGLVHPKRGVRQRGSYIPLHLYNVC